MHFARIGIVVFALIVTTWRQALADNVIVYDITAHIDTNDFLLIQGSTLQWHHMDGGAAVGRHNGNNFATVVASSLNGTSQMSATSWTPTWPREVPFEIRFDAFSSTFSPLGPALPAVEPLSVEASVVSGRGSLTVTQLPSDANSDVLIVRFSDGFNGSADLRGLITVTVPEPGLAVFSGAVVLLLGRRTRVNRR
jgi:hypothetical protein